ncbi:lytic transglycosylase domain-containing protein [Sphingomonas psychrotolerans]|uniref:Lytic transglycosylase domain-containing protein n=1 Tax=Sphingomonas psychrotolerans TaxID=1327635 RepID=A0ABU3N818_9SPHN|nr:lytic transglycosylase domain-containing protein [Sphingomonas psychrotolerans]MDT8760649.1 lytic transglycosylase domain-containing protein [Sphingomonas psychrotolerans]
MSIASVTSRAGIQTAIAAASRKTGIDFNYLLGQAQVESGLRADARAATSSATGLYQFIEQSWLGVIKDHGAEHGLGWAADSIRQTASGRYIVSDPTTRRAILDMRRDPGTAALMAAEHASDNKAALEQRLDRPATGTDLYMAHFLGRAGAAKFLGAMERNPGQTGAALFPAAARANRGVFYAGDGQPRTLGEIYARFAGKLDQGAAAVGATGLASDAVNAFATGLDDFSDTEVLLGNDAVDGDRHWIETTLAQLEATRGPTGTASGERLNPFRPTPETAKLAYLMLARLGA